MIPENAAAASVYAHQLSVVEVEMDERTVNEIKKDFRAWSGGFPPESDYQIYVYIDAANPFDIVEAELWDMLQTWMNEDEPTEPER